MLCGSPWEARPFLNEDAGRVDQEGVDGKEKWKRGGGETGWYVKKKVI